jgi:hypothetical protein
MDLKNAAAVCLISLFSVTLVVLIARSLDSQAASRLEPQLANIVEELRALRGQGGIGAAPGVSSEAETGGDGLVVYYFHSNVRCPTCRSIESQTRETVQNHFASQLGNREVIWKVVNYEQPAAKPLATRFEIQMPVVVLAKMRDGKVQDWKRLDEVWGLVGDQPAFTKYLRGEIERMLSPVKKPEPATTKTPGPRVPLPGAGSTRAKASPPLPLP